MDRRTFLRAAAASTGSAAVAGCLDDEETPVSELGDESTPRYELPAYSALTPTETADGRGMVFIHLRLASFRTAQQAAATGRLADDPLVELPLSGLTAVPAAVETITQYPFAPALRTAVNDAAAGQTEGEGADRNDTVVDPLNETAGGNSTIIGADDGSETVDEDGTNTENTTTNGTETDEENEIGGEAELPTGIEIAELTLIDGLLICNGTFDRQIIADRYATGFERVDNQRGVWIYEATDESARGFAVSRELLIVPTATGQRSVAAQTALAHSLSSYINTLGRISDDDDGQWLFETTGPTACSIGVWGADNSIARLTETVGSALDTSTDGTAVLGSVGDFISALELSVDDTGELTSLEARFSGLFPETVPTEDELRAALASEAAERELTVDDPRVRLTASFDSV